LRIQSENGESDSRSAHFALTDDTFRQGRIAWMSDNQSLYYM